LVSVFIYILSSFSNASLPFFFRPFTSSAESKLPALILGWTQIFGKSLVSELGTTVLHCPTATCLFTGNRSLLNSSQVVFFHERDFSLMDLPERRHTSQMFVIANWEAPVYLAGKTAFLNDNFFNLTMTYRRDSDIFAPYVSFEEMNDTHELSDMDLRELINNKTKHIARFVSNCFILSHREALQKYIPVDIYGACGPLTCPRENDGCKELLRKEYRFYLAFENTICLDYVTEKSLTALSTYVVPIVLSRSVSQPLLPSNSFAAVDDFDSPKRLSELLYLLGNDTSRYVTYFQYKGKYIAHRKLWTRSFCRLCDHISTDRKPSVRKTKNFNFWFRNGSNCAAVFVVDDPETSFNST
uniref:Fucosyltransferase n=1 Tax=Soboliphyme baturini TaxID=241478 RepID=A0A183J5Y4_9BILA